MWGYSRCSGRKGKEINESLLYIKSYRFILKERRPSFRVYSQKDCCKDDVTGVEWLNQLSNLRFCNSFFHNLSGSKKLDLQPWRDWSETECESVSYRNRYQVVPFYLYLRERQAEVMRCPFCKLFPVGFSRKTWVFTGVSTCQSILDYILKTETKKTFKWKKSPHLQWSNQNKKYLALVFLIKCSCFPSNSTASHGERGKTKEKKFKESFVSKRLWTDS